MEQRNVIVFGAHPDDIEIGMGGTIKKLTDHNKLVIACIATVPDMHKRRKQEVERAANILGVTTIKHLNMRSDHFGFNRETVSAIDRVIQQYNPDAVFTHWTGDSHQDHINLTNSVLAAARHNHFNVFMYEQAIPGGITHASFRPQLYIDISPYIEAKVESILAHKSQSEKYGAGWMNGVRGRAMHRGFQIKVSYAEAFEVVKIKEHLNLFKTA